MVLVGWQHPFYTAFFGIGLAIARLNKNWFIKILAPLVGISIGMFTHSFHNTLAVFTEGLGGMAFGTLIDWTGWFIMFCIILWATWREGQNLKMYLNAEAQAGTISAAHVRTACSAWLQMFARIAAIFSGRYFKTTRFYQVCGEYAHKRQQYAKLGDESGNVAILNKLRSEMAQLAAQVQV